MYITIKEPARQGFLAALARAAEPSFSLWQQGDGLDAGGLSPALIAAALAFGAFPAYEQQQLTRLSRQRFSCFGPREQAELCRLSLALLANDVSRDAPASGPRRLLQVESLLRDRLTAAARQAGRRPTARFDFDGFCRFCLPGYISYLNYTLDIAADELLARLEDEEFHALLGQVARPEQDGPRLRLEFLPGGLFVLGREGKQGCRLEAGPWAGHEDMLLANLLMERPASLLIKGAAFAPLSVTSLLEQVLEEKISYSSAPDALDNPSQGCYDV